VTSEVGHPRLSAVLDLEDLDGAVGRAGGQPRAVVVHLGVMDHVLVDGKQKTEIIFMLCHIIRNNGLCFDKIISLYFCAPKTTTIDIGGKRKSDFSDLLKNLSKMTNF
jgi:hypothetical protein